MGIEFVDISQVTFDKSVLRGQIQQSIAWHDPSERDFLAFRDPGFRSLLPEDMDILDIGANIGSSAVGFRKVGLKNKIHCFEPNRFLVNILNDITPDIGNVEIHGFGVGSENATFKLYVPFVDSRPIHQEASVIKEHLLQPFVENRLKSYGSKIEITTIDCEIRIVDDLNMNPGFIKIDVEGLEPAAIGGATETIKKNKPLIHVENNAVDIVQSLLEPLGYTWMCYNSNENILGKHINHYNRWYIPNEKLGHIQHMIRHA